MQLEYMYVESKRNGYNLIAIDNWGYKEGTDEKKL